jgi:hypothetical protein
MLMVWGFTIADLTALLMVAFTFATTVANILLWVSTRRTVTILLEQVRHQIASGYSEAQQSLVGAHRDLFFGILKSPTLLDAFTKANGLEPKAWELQKVSEFLINQVLIGYLHFRNGIISGVHLEGFKRDAQDVFSYNSVRSHWEKIRQVHSEDFRLFVETELLYREV